MDEYCGRFCGGYHGNENLDIRGEIGGVNTSDKGQSVVGSRPVEYYVMSLILVSILINHFPCGKAGTWDKVQESKKKKKREYVYHYFKQFVQ